jgi:hypothetical protein
MLTIQVKNVHDAKHVAVWGTYDKGGFEHCKGTCPLHQYREVRLADCSTEHLQTLWTNDWLDNDYKRIVEAILDDRGKPYEIQPEYRYVVQYRVVPKLRHTIFGLRIVDEMEYRIVKRRIS